MLPELPQNQVVQLEVLVSFVIRDTKMYSQIFYYSHQHLFSGSYYHGRAALFSCVNFEIMLKRKQTFHSAPNFS